MTKHLSAFALFLTIAFTSHSQLTSSTSTWNIETDSVLQISKLWLNTVFDDISNVGGVQISAYDLGAEKFLTEFSQTRTELINNGFLSSESLAFPLLDVDPERQYRIQVNIYNLDGTYIPLEELITTL